MVSSEILQGTVFHWTYRFFGVAGDEELIYRMTLIAIIYTAIVGVYSIFKPAPYGRHSQELPSTFSFTMNASAAWFIQEVPACVVPLILLFQTQCLKLTENNINKIALTLFVAHYLHRSVIFPFRIKNPKPVPVLTCLSAIIFCSYNGFLQGHYLMNVGSVESSPHTLFGILIFLIGMTINIYYDGVLIALRKNSGKTASGKTEYKIPRGGLFELISGANFFGEIVEWWGLFMITKGLPQLTFALFTNVFIGLRAWHHHKWYKTTFGKSYPKKRKAILPFIF